MSAHGTLFDGMLQEFAGAARILNREPGIWQILAHPKREIIVSCPARSRRAHELSRSSHAGRTETIRFEGR